MKTIFIVLAVIAVQPAFADAPPYRLYSVKVFTSSRTHAGYLWMGADSRPNKPETLAKLKAKGGRIAIESDLVKIKYPTEMLVSTSPSLSINISDITKIERIPNKYQKLASVQSGPSMTFRTATLLQGKPHYSCVGDTGGAVVHWLSYNKLIGKKELENYCLREIGNNEIESDRHDAANAMLEHLDIMLFVFYSDHIAFVEGG